MSSAPTTILVVDDDKKISDFLNDLLSEAGYDFRAAYDGREALERLATPEREEIDLVLLDVVMPEIDGFSVCSQLKSSPDTERLPIIMVSGRDEVVDKSRGL